MPNALQTSHIILHLIIVASDIMVDIRLCKEYTSSLLVNLSLKDAKSPKMSLPSSQVAVGMQAFSVSMNSVPDPHRIQSHPSAEVI